MITRIGQGWDLHRLVPGRKLILGGVVIPFDRGEEGNSDGDVLIHAVIDALLGAAAAGDIGTHFPPDDPACKGASSRSLLKETMKLLYTEKYSVDNVDTTVILEKPKLKDHIVEIRQTLAADMGISLDQISVKAKTAEGFGPVGLGDAVEAHAVASLREL
jgi:2-C-methyl-D-erythritol 2,4-cyclodiphosphate synthase